ncbi:MAG: hypothetical protein EOO85_33665, partial [Pedobacter sp.]
MPEEIAAVNTQIVTENALLIKDLAVISDRKTCALVSNQGNIVWYCPERFDGKAILSTLIDDELGGFWNVELKNKVFLGRQFQERSSVLNTYFSINGEGLTITDYMPLGLKWNGICRKFSQSPSPLLNKIRI